MEIGNDGLPTEGGMTRRFRNREARIVSSGANEARSASVRMTKGGLGSAPSVVLIPRRQVTSSNSVAKAVWIKTRGEWLQK